MEYAGGADDADDEEDDSPEGKRQRGFLLPGGNA